MKKLVRLLMMLMLIFASLTSTILAFEAKSGDPFSSDTFKQFMREAIANERLGKCSSGAKEFDQMMIGKSEDSPATVVLVNELATCEGREKLKIIGPPSEVRPPHD